MVHRHRRQGSQTDEEGAVLVEFALVVGLFLTLVFGMIDYGLGINSLTQLNNAGREGARLATVNPDPTAVENRIKGAITKLDTSLLSITITCEDDGGLPCTGTQPAGDLRNGSTGDTVTVLLSYEHDILTPIPSFLNPDGKFTLKSTTEMRIE